MHLDPLDMPFDQYQRYRLASEVIGLLRSYLESARPRVLDLGGYFKTHTGEDILPATLFIADADITVVDLTECRLDKYIRASGTALPFASGVFDVVVSCDTLEHIPPSGRTGFVDELLRVSRSYTILAAPFYDERSVAAERILFEYVKRHFGFEQPQLREHLTYGLPHRDLVCQQLTERGLAFVDFPHGYFHHWFPMMVVKHFILTLPDPVPLHTLVDRYFNENFYASSLRAPGYRHVFVIAQRGCEAPLARVREAYQPAEEVAGDDGLAFGQAILSLLDNERESEFRKIRQVLAESLPRAEATLSQPLAAPVPVPVCGELPRCEDGVLVLAPDDIREAMSGPSVRYWEIASALSKEHRVTLAAPNQVAMTDERFAVQTYRQPEQFAALAADHAVVLLQGFTLLRHPHLLPLLRQYRNYLVVDLYGPLTLEGLEIRGAGASDADVGDYLVDLSVLSEQIKIGDFFICASERQRDYWLGMLTALNRVNPHEYHEDRMLRQLIDVVPFGLPSRPPVHRKQVLKGVHPRVAPTDKVLLWWGGLWDWLDPLTVIRAFAGVVASHPNARLVFCSGRRESEPTFATEEKAVQLSRELGLLDQSAIFHQWTPYADRENYLLEADIGVSFHHKHLETRFSFRTRLLDYFWAGLPILAGSGDVLGDLVTREGLGCTARPGDVDGLREAMSSLLDEPDARLARRDAFARVKAQFTWESAVTPLDRFCRHPHHAADRQLEVYQRWSSSNWERLLREAVRADQLERDVHMLLDALEKTRAHSAYLEGRACELETLANEKEQFIHEIMNGRVMRLMTGTQKWLRRIRGNED